MDFTTEIYFTDYLEHDSGHSGHILLNEYLYCSCKGILTLCRRTDIDRYIDYDKINDMLQFKYKSNQIFLCNNKCRFFTMFIL